jgi:hypothetical protein
VRNFCLTRVEPVCCNPCGLQQTAGAQRARERAAVTLSSGALLQSASAGQAQIPTPHTAFSTPLHSQPHCCPTRPQRWATQVGAPLEVSGWECRTVYSGREQGGETPAGKAEAKYAPHDGEGEVRC